MSFLWNQNHRMWEQEGTGEIIYCCCFFCCSGQQNGLTRKAQSREMTQTLLAIASALHSSGGGESHWHRPVTLNQRQFAPTPQGTFGLSGDNFGWHDWDGGWCWHWGYRPGVLLNILYIQKSPPEQRLIWIISVFHILDLPFPLHP